MAQSGAVLGGLYARPFPGGDVVTRIQSKREQLERAVQAGVDIPATAHPASAEEARAALGRDRLPLARQAVEPRRLPRAFPAPGVPLRERRASSTRAYADAEPFAPMVQELIPGGDDELYTVGSYIAADGTVLGLFCGRKLRQTPPGVGTCRVGEALWVDEVVDAALRLLRAFAFHGISQVEFKRDPARRPLQADGDQPAALAVARSRRRTRRRHPADRLSRPSAAADARAGDDGRKDRTLGADAATQASHLLSCGRRTSIRCWPSTIRSPASPYLARVAKAVVR